MKLYQGFGRVVVGAALVVLTSMPADDPEIGLAGSAPFIRAVAAVLVLASCRSRRPAGHHHNALVIPPAFSILPTIANRRDPQWRSLAHAPRPAGSG